MDEAALVRAFVFLACASVVALGGAMAWAAGSVVKRIAGVALAYVGAGAMAAALGDGQLALAALAAGAAIVILGAAICARLAESYGVAEWDQINRAGRQVDPPQEGSQQ